MREAVIVASARTPLAKSFRGSFKLTRPDDLAAHCIRSVLAKVPEVAFGEVEDVIFGCAFPQGPQGYNVARIAALLAGIPVTAAGATVNRFCASGLQAIAAAAHEVIHEGLEVAIGGGVESISFIGGAAADRNPRLAEKCPGIYMTMGETAEIVARRYQISREAQDEYAFQSQQRTAIAQARGLLAAEIAPIPVRCGVVNKSGGAVVEQTECCFEHDECNRPDTNLAGLASLPACFDTTGKGTVTAGNSSQLADGASAALVMSRQRAETLGLAPLLAFRGLAVAGCAPEEMGIGPVYAVPRLLERHGLRVGDIDLWEMNEAFAVQVVYCRDRLGIDPDHLNVNGGAISLGHPYGASGARLVGALGYEMTRRMARFGVVTMCVGAGQGAAALFESCR